MTLPGVTFGDDVSAETGLTRSDEIATIPHEKLHDHSANPPGRVEFDAIADLIQSIDRFGQREPVRVRDAGPLGHYQILSGHRRVAACRMLGRDVRCEIVDCGDEEALREVMLGNADRKDLDPIERAELLEQMIEAGIDREQAGAMFGLTSESGVKNTLRLLKLPECVRSMVREGLMPVRLARQFVPCAAAETMLAAEMAKLREDKWELQDLREGEMTIDVNWFAQNVTYRPMTGKYNPGYEYEDAERGFEPTKAQIKKLDVAEVPFGKNGAMIEIAQNVALFDKLNKPHLVKRTGYGGGTSAATKKKSDPKPQLTPAQQKAKEAEQDKQRKTKLQVWRRRWIRCLLATQVPAMDPLILTTVLWWLQRAGNSDGDAYVEAAMETLGMQLPKRRNKWDRMDSGKLLECMIAAAVEMDSNVPDGYSVIDRTWRVLVWPQWIKWPTDEAFTSTSELITQDLPKKMAYDPSGTWRTMDKELDAMVAAAKIDPAAEWTASVDEPLDERIQLVVEYLNLHNKRQLERLAAAAKIDLGDPSKTKGKVVDTLLAYHADTRKLPLPAVLKAKPKPKAKGKAR